MACEGFVQTAILTGEGEGIQGLRVANYPGHVAVDSDEETRKKAKEIVLSQVIKALTDKSVASRKLVVEPGPKDFVFTGTSDQVNRYFYEKGWGDGLPIVPPTVKRVEEFLKHTPLRPETVIGPLPPENRQATVWNVAVNGVMSGCRPEYMPVLVAIAEAIADPKYHLQDAGSTSGLEPMVVLNGPVIEQLGFNYGVGMLRPGRQANISVGRFLRMYMRNIAGFRAGLSDKSAFGRNGVAMVFVEDPQHNPWEPLSVERGFKKDSNVVTMLGVLDMGEHNQPSVDNAKGMLDRLAVMLKYHWQDAGYMMLEWGPEHHDILCVTPLIANLIAKDFSKNEAKKYLFEKARLPARVLEERQLIQDPTYSLKKQVEKGLLPKVFAESDDPNRLVPGYRSADELFILVGGDYTRNRAFVMRGIGRMLLSTSREIKLPTNWNKLVPKPLQQ